MRVKWWIGLGCLLGLLASFLTTSTAAQSAVQMFGTFSGAAKAITVTTDGYVNVSIQ